MMIKSSFQVVQVLALFGMLTLFAPTSAHAGVLNPGEYEGVKVSSLEIVQGAPPSEYVYVGIGRSPTSIIAFLSILFPESSVGLSLSGADSLERAVTYGGQPMRSKVDAHFEAVLGPVIANLQGRKLLFIDYVETGSFLSALNLLEEFLRRYHPEVKFDFRALATEQAVVGKKWLKKDKVISLSTKSREFQRRLIDSEYDLISPIGSWHINDDPRAENHSEKANYVIYEDELRTQMLNDSSLAEEFERTGNMKAGSCRDMFN